MEDMILQDYFHPSLSRDARGSLSALGLAHMGDAVYELLVRSYLCDRGLSKCGNLHRATVARVAAPAQARVADAIVPLLTDAEQAVFRRGRNAHVHAIPKNATHEQYSKATGLEALFGSLFLSGQTQRVNELFCAGMEVLDAL